VITRETLFTSLLAMEVAALQPHFNPHSNLNNMDSAMEMDIDIDLEPLPEVDAIDVVCALKLTFFLELL
jgi:hypothetical protein